MKANRLFFMMLGVLATLGPPCVRAQQPTNAPEEHQQQTQTGAPGNVAPDTEATPSASTSPQGNSSAQAQDGPASNSNPSEQINPQDQAGKQTKRILWIIPNYRAVSANTQLPPMRFKEKLWLGTEDTFDYSNFIFVGGLAGISYAQNSQASFGQGAAGYGRYYWHIFLDGAIENYMVETLAPAATREDPRYYTLGHGGFFKRTGYAVSRLFLTRTDSGKKNSFNISEIIGAGIAAGIGNVYYPPQANNFVKTYQRWGTQVGLDGVFNVLKEFWPDIDRVVFHGKY